VRRETAEEHEVRGRSRPDEKAAFGALAAKIRLALNGPSPLRPHLAGDIRRIAATLALYMASNWRGLGEPPGRQCRIASSSSAGRAGAGARARSEGGGDPHRAFAAQSRAADRAAKWSPDLGLARFCDAEAARGSDRMNGAIGKLRVLVIEDEGLVGHRANAGCNPCRGDRFV
jgi:hypothetical protein